MGMYALVTEKLVGSEGVITGICVCGLSRPQILEA